MPEEIQGNQNTQANENSVAVGNVNVGGSIGGDFFIGNKGFSVEEVSVLITKISTTFQPKPFDGRCPYKGLDVFEEEDADMFFGREKLVEDLVSRVKDSRTVFVTGPSGSGKSSLVRAGLIHALKQGALRSVQSERWLYASLKPGRDPIEALANAFSRLKSPELGNYFRGHAQSASALNECAESALTERQNQRFVLFIDQFEEIFTQLSKAKAEMFIQLLDCAAGMENGRVILLFAMRSDFISNCATFPRLNALLNQQFVQIGAMQPEELVSAIAQPALRVGLGIDPDLVAQIINDMKGEPGSLPLMQFALKDLFDSQQAKVKLIDLNLKDYLERGGIRKALERHADTSFTQLDGHEQELARSIFTKLIEIGRGTQDTRRTAVFDELIPENASAADIQAIVQKLSDARLITTDESAGKDTVTISHEKLIDAWPWLKKLVNENRDVIALQNEIAEDAKEWDENKHDASYLYTGARLVNANEKLKSKELTLSGTALEYIRAGQARQRRGRVLLISGISLLLVASIIAAIVFRNQAEEARNLTNIALARQLVAQAQSINVTRSSKQSTAVLLGIQSMRMFPSSGSAQILLNDNLAAHPVSRMSHDGAVYSVIFSPNGEYVASEGCDKYDASNVCVQGSALVWETATGKEVARMTHDDWVRSIAFSPDGKYVVSGSEDQTIRVWEALTGKEIARMRQGREIASVSFSPDGKYILSAGGDKTARVWETVSGKEVARLNVEAELSSAAFSPDGKYIVTGEGWIRPRDPVKGGGGGFFSARVWEVSTSREISHMEHLSFVTSVAFDREGKYVASAGWDSVRVWEATTGKEIALMVHQGESRVNVAAFSSDGRYIVSAGQDGTARVWDVSSGREISRMRHDGAVTSAVFSPDSQYVVSGSLDGTARVWEVATGKEVARMTHDAAVNSVAFRSDGRYVVSGSLDGTARVWVASAQNEITRNMMYGDRSGTNFVFSPDRKYAVSWGCDQYNDEGICFSSFARVWETLTGRHVANIRHTGEMIYYAFSPDDKYLVSWACDEREFDFFDCISSTTYVWEQLTGKEVAHMSSEGDITDVAFSSDSKSLVSWGCTQYNASPDAHYCISSSVRTSEVLTGKEVIHKTYEGEITSVAFSPDEKYIVAWGCDQYDENAFCASGSARAWNARTGSQSARVIYHARINSVDFSPDGKYVASGSEDGMVSTWEVATGDEVARKTYEGSVTSVTFSPDGTYVALWGCTKPIRYKPCTQSFIRVWEFPAGKESIRITYDGSIASLIFSPNGKNFVLGGCDTLDISLSCTRGSAYVWEPRTGKQTVRTTNDGYVYPLAFSPDGKYVVSSIGDGMASVWEAATGKEVARRKHDGAVLSAAFSPNGKYVISESTDDTIRAWLWRPEDLIASACAVMPRNLTRPEWDQYVGDVLPYQAVCNNLPIDPGERTTTP